MKDVIKEILFELVSYGKEQIELKRLKKSEETIGIDFTLTIIKEMLYWQKMVIAGDDFIDDDIQEDRYIVDELLQDKYMQFFECFDNINELFDLYQVDGKEQEDDENKWYLSFSQSLSEEEISEIQTYIEDNYQVKIRLRKF